MQLNTGTLARLGGSAIEDLLQQLLMLPLIFEEVRAAAAEGSIRAAEVRCSTRLPDELKTLLRRFNGTTGPTDTDHGWLQFWAAEELELASGAAGYRERSDLVVFADHGLNAMWYAIESARPDGEASRVFLLASCEPEVIANSLSDFLRAVIEGSPTLFTGNPTG